MVGKYFCQVIHHEWVSQTSSGCVNGGNRPFGRVERERPLPGGTPADFSGNRPFGIQTVVDMLWANYHCNP